MVFFFADGYVSKKHKTCKIDLQECDVDLLEKFKEVTEYSGNINEYIAKLGQSYRSVESIVKRIHVINKTFSEILENDGVHPHREKSNFPYHCVNECFYKDFIRGYFDGNGSISFSKKPFSLTINICGGTNILQDIENITSHYNFKWSHHPRKDENPDNDQIFITGGKLEKIRFATWLYKDSKYYLNRKYNKFLEVCKA